MSRAYGVSDTLNNIIMSDVGLTPLIGGKEDGGVASLLEIGGFRILLDCGTTIATGNDKILASIVDKIKEKGGVDCIILSHADIHHMGGLPVLFGEGGLSPVPVLCSLPVHKFGTMLLYDMQLNVEMEGKTEDEGNGSSSRINYPRFSLDDLDNAMSRVYPLKYSQTIDLLTLLYSQRVTTSIEDDEEKIRRMEAAKISFCAYNSGRTIGGSTWNIRYGSTDVVYLMDFNLKKETVLDVVALDALPRSPSMVIVNGNCVAHADVKTAPAVTSRKRKEAGSGLAPEDPSSLTGLVMETLRGRGSVLIPCESCARSLELFQLLGSHWVEQKLGLDHLVFLSPMAYNILEYARSQLEWMTNSLSTAFFNGKTNPFELPPLKIATSVRELEKAYPGPKVVIATDGALACGLAKELLLRWGGNPLCRVLFVDYPDEHTPAAALKAQMASASKVVNLTRPQKVELAGEELLQFRREAEEKRRLKEEAIQKKLREQELAMLTAVKGAEAEDTDEEDEEDEEDGLGMNNGDREGGMDVDEEDESEAAAAARQVRDEKRKEKERRKSSSARQTRSRIAKFAQPLFTMFETFEKNIPSDEYGASLEDLQLAGTDEADDAAGAGPASMSKNINSLAASGGLDDSAELANANEMPWKIVSTDVRLQFTCDFRVVPLSGRADVRALKTALNRLRPLRVCLLRGAQEDVANLAQQLDSTDMEVFSPGNGDKVTISATPDRVSLTIPPDLMPPVLVEIRSDGGITSVGGASGDTGASGATLSGNSCFVSAIKGGVEEVKNEKGLRRVRLVDKGILEEKDEATAVDSADADEEGKAEKDEDYFPDVLQYKTMPPAGGPDAKLDLVKAQEDIAVSVGEVSLSSLKRSFEEAGLPVESSTVTNSDGSIQVVLIIDGQVTVRKEDSDGNNLLVEGAPVSAYWAVRKTIYSRFAFLMT